MLRRCRRDWTVFGAFGGTGVLQALVSLRTDDEVGRDIEALGFAGFGFTDVFTITARSVHGVYVFGADTSESFGFVREGLTPAFVGSGSVVMSVLVPVVLLLTVQLVLTWRAPRVRQLAVFVLVGYSVVFFAGPMVIRDITAGRYAVVPSMMLASALALAVGPRSWNGTSTLGKIAAGGFVVHLALVCTLGFSVRTLRAEWSGTGTNSSPRLGTPAAALPVTG